MVAEPEPTSRDDVVAVVRAVLARARDVAGGGAGVLGGGVDDAVRALVDHRVQRAMRSTGPPPTAVDLVLALSADRSPASARRLGDAGVWLAKRGKVARALGGRTPAGLALRFGPGLYDAVSGGLRGLDAAAGHLVGRAREQGIEPEPARVRAAVVQALTGAPVDPSADPDHAALARLWLAEAGRRAAPFGLGRISGLSRGRTADAVAAALGRVDVGALRGR